MVRLYFVSLAVFTVLTVLMAIPGVSILVMVFTFGLTR